MHNAHHSALAAKHAVLDHRIMTELQRPLPNAATLSKLKKLKLKIKEELASA